MQKRSGEDSRPEGHESNAEQQRKRAIARALKNVTQELKYTDVVDLITYVRTDHHANIADLVKSSSELFFKQDTLRYGLQADVDLDWDSHPTVSLDLEFYHRGVSAFFTLILRAKDNAINVAYVEVENSSGDADDDTKRLIDAMEDARTRSRG